MKIKSKSIRLTAYLLVVKIHSYCDQVNLLKSEHRHTSISQEIRKKSDIKSSQCELSEDRLDWHILVGNDESNHIA